jgi:hypothetical protein
VGNSLRLPASAERKRFIKPLVIRRSAAAAARRLCAVHNYCVLGEGYSLLCHSGVRTPEFAEPYGYTDPRGGEAYGQGHRTFGCIADLTPASLHKVCYDLVALGTSDVIAYMVANATGAAIPDIRIVGFDSWDKYRSRAQSPEPRARSSELGALS